MRTLHPDFETAEYQENLHEFLNSLHKNYPAFINNEGIVYLSTYEDCQRLLQDGSFIRRPTGSASAFSLGSAPGQMSLCEQMIDHWMIYQDPPHHTRLRNIFNRIFIPKAIDNLRPDISSTAQKLLDNMPRGQTFDFMDAVAYQFPVLVIAAFFDIPYIDLAQFKRWSYQLSQGLNTGKQESFHHADEAITEFRNYFAKLFMARKDTPGNDLLGMMIKACHASELSHEEVIDTAIFMVWAGHETTKLMISNGLLLLLQHPQQQQYFCQHPESTRKMIEEVLRFESPIQKTSRWASETCEFQGSTIAKNTLITALIGAANRDPDIYTSANEFIINRSENRNLAFGKGIHHCLGAYLARTEGEILFNLLRPLLPAIQLIEYQWRPTSAFRCLDKLLIRID